VSTLEIKSGYGLDLKTEIKMLEVAKSMQGPQITTTFLGAHALPKEFDSYTEYLNYITDVVLPVVKRKKLANRVDIFIEKNFFESRDAKIFLQKAKDLNFDLTIHANQLSESGGAELAVELNAKSADHVIHLSDETIQNFSKAKTVAVLLPTADLYMKCAYPKARELIDAGATVALSTDFNPGSCPSQDLMLVGLLARLEMKMTLPEIFLAYTKNAATALGIQNLEGDFSVGKLANFICTDAKLADFFYSAGRVPEHQLFIRGKAIKV
jgi:imidazolonepropionase